jgi:hypothetical protein
MNWAVRPLKHGLMLSACLLAFFAALVLVVVVVKPSPGTTLYVFGVHAHQASSPDVGVNLSGVLWWFIGIPIANIALTLWRRRRSDKISQLRSSRKH